MKNTKEVCTIRSNINYIQFPCDDCICSDKKFKKCLEKAVNEINLLNGHRKKAVI